jgi:C4-dicarboxylate transporter, DctQ subunit
MQKIIAGYDWLINAMRVASGVTIVLVFVLIVSDVFIRLVGGPLFGVDPWIYSAGIVEYSLLWFAMLAAPWLVRVKGHVFIDAITQIMPGRIQYYLAKVSYLISVCAAIVFFWFSLDLFLAAWWSNELDIRGEDMPLWTLLIPIPICFFFVTIEFSRYLFGFDDMYGDRTDVRENV